MAEREHDGVRRWAIYYRNLDGSKGTFYSDAVTMGDAQAHFDQSCPDARSTHIRTVRPDDWLDKT